MLLFKCVSVFLLFPLVLSVLSNDSNYLEELEKDLQRIIAEYQQYQTPIDNSEYFPNCNKIKLMPSADFVVIGAGTAGAIIAKRLSENSKIKITVIEAGGFENNLTSIPGFSVSLFNSPFNWDYKSTPMKHAAFGFKDQIQGIPRGKGFGGSTIINGLRYVRGSKFVFLNSNNHKEWNFNTMLNYYKKSENSNLGVKYEDKDYHGHYGPTNVEFAKDKIPQIQATIQAMQEIGFKIIDYNGKEELGVSPAQMTIKDGFRISTGKAFINPIKNQSNVKLLNNALALKILFNEKRNKATSVIISKNNNLYQIPVNKEIILSGGVINSPQLLMVSGIGPAEDLNKLNIELIKDLPVGRNLRDHPASPSIYVNFDKKFAVPQKSMKEYLKELLEEGSGLYSVASAAHALSFHKTKYAKENDGHDLICSYASPLYLNNPSPEHTDLKREYYEEIYKNVDLDTVLTIMCINTNSLSRGKVTLKSASIFDYPIIDINSLEYLQDALVLGEYSEIIKNMLESVAFKKYNASAAYINLPGCEEFEFLSSQWFVCASKHVGHTGYHMFNTCTMGNDAKDSVVNSRLKVHGINNLRVVDGSVIERISGYPMAVVMAYAERASDLIKEDNKLF